MKRFVEKMGCVKTWKITYSAPLKIVFGER